jgi:hypothetical protein
MVVCPQISVSTLALLVARVSTDHPNHTLAADDLAVTAHLLDRSSDFHGLLLDLNNLEISSLSSENDTTLRQIVWRQFNGYFIAWKNADVVHSHFS